MPFKQTISMCFPTEKIVLDPEPRVSKTWMIYSIVSGSSLSENIAPFLLLTIAIYS